MYKPKWSYGITTIPERFDSHFLKTFHSLRTSGFDQPHLFIDNCNYAQEFMYHNLGVEMSRRYPRVKTFANWIISLQELYSRAPLADRFALFQDDFITGLNLHEYLDSCEYPAKGYWNLYTFPSNQEILPKNRNGWFPSNQLGRGAVALVFNRETVVNVLSSQDIAAHQQGLKGYKRVDGAVIDALKKIGWKEYVHNPSLIQHTGIQSSMGSMKQPLSPSFPGEDFDFTCLNRATENSAT